MKKSKILYGVCGIGNGHTFRQLPIIEHFSENSDIVIFAYGESLDFYSKRFKDNPSIHIEQVAVPFYVGNDKGLDFIATAQHPANQDRNFHAINNSALSNVQRHIGKPDIVISDYEPICAQYAYAYDAPLITIDQQSKYLCGKFPQPLNGQYFQDEVARLGMFFPKAHKRFACSFFNVPALQNPIKDVDVIAPVLNDWITQMKRTPDPRGKTILTYFSSQQPFKQSLSDIAEAFSQSPETTFHLFGKGFKDGGTVDNVPNIRTYAHGNPEFKTLLKNCNGLITTAGHTLLSETMYLGIPTYAVPLPLYEQEMNAHVIGANHFGISRPTIDSVSVQEFIENIPSCANNIKQDTAHLLRTQGKDGLIQTLDQLIYTA